MCEFSEGTVEMVRFVPHERVQQRTVEHVPQIAEETVEVVGCASISGRDPQDGEVTAA